VKTIEKPLKKQKTTTHKQKPNKNIEKPNTTKKNKVSGD
jgi:hypothetical protein